MPFSPDYEPSCGPSFQALVRRVYGTFPLVTVVCCQVPYVLDRGYNKTEAEVILQAMEEFHKYTSVKFVERTSEETR